MQSQCHFLLVKKVKIAENILFQKILLHCYLHCILITLFKNISKLVQI